MNKKWVLLLIIAFPSLIWLFLESSNINSRKLPHYGPKKILSANDTLFHRVSDSLYKNDCKEALTLGTDEFPLYVVMFMDPKYRPENYRLAGLIEYLQYKPEKVRHIPFVFVGPCKGDSTVNLHDFDHLPSKETLHFLTYPEKEFPALVKQHFAAKPYYIDFSFMLLIDAQRHIRGYYDSRYVSEIKRLTEEYQHLRLKEEQKKLLKNNEIKSNS